ncbi:hypothetical protein [Pseudomonas tolaasii]|uniref:hypothetical protein n=1 Tax=Pseudomonas tolaasii TaxID=29442 RepID=UPI00037A14C7|nr:hypothetical protein [Pseudomonas tolaasii]
MSEGIRPTQDRAENSIAEFLAKKFAECPPFHMCEDGDDGWAFWIVEQDGENDGDTTSYVHHDLKIEWYGTSYDPTDDQQPA